MSLGETRLGGSGDSGLCEAMSTWIYSMPLNCHLTQLKCPALCSVYLTRIFKKQKNPALLCTPAVTDNTTKTLRKGKGWAVQESKPSIRNQQLLLSPASASWVHRVSGAHSSFLSTLSCSLSTAPLLNMSAPGTSEQQPVGLCGYALLPPFPLPGTQ